MQAISKYADAMFTAIERYNSTNWQNEWTERLDDLIYIAMIKTAIKSKHQRYLIHDSTLINQLRLFKPLFLQMDEVAATMAEYSEVMY